MGAGANVIKNLKIRQQTSSKSHFYFKLYKILFANINYTNPLNSPTTISVNYSNSPDFVS